MCKISGRRHPLTPKIKVETDSLAEQEMCFFVGIKPSQGFGEFFSTLPTRLPKPAYVCILLQTQFAHLVDNFARLHEVSRVLNNQTTLNRSVV